MVRTRESRNACTGHHLFGTGRPSAHKFANEVANTLACAGAYSARRLQGEFVHVSVGEHRVSRLVALGDLLLVLALQHRLRAVQRGVVCHLFLAEHLRIGAVHKLSDASTTDEMCNDTHPASDLVSRVPNFEPILRLRAGNKPCDFYAVSLAVC